MSLPDPEYYDAVVVGMGPAGAVAACAMSQAGLSVLGLERHPFPRDKVCGGGLSARVDHLLEPDYKRVVEQTIHGVQFTYRGADPFLLTSASPIAYMVRRDRFDQFLAENARAAGTCLREGEEAQAFVPMADGIEVCTNRGRYRGRVVIGADGANSRVASQLFPVRKQGRRPSLESEIDIGSQPLYPGKDTVLIDLGATHQGYAWVFPKSERLSVGVAEFRGRLTNPRRIFQRFVANDERLATFDVPQPCGHPLPLYQVAGGPVPGGLVNHRAMLVGDAGHLVDPLFGEGIYYALRSGQMAADSVLGMLRDRRVPLAAYKDAVYRELYPEFRVASRLARIVYTFPRLCHRMIQRYQDVIELYYGVLQGRETYQTFFVKAKGLVKASFRELLREATPLR